MKMKDWDTASFDNYKEAIKYFNLEEAFVRIFNMDIDSHQIGENDKYLENSIINHCLSMMKTPSNVMWFSGYNEELNSFDISKMEIIPKDREDADLMMEFLKTFKF